jgi:hypothetical protein
LGAIFGVNIALAVRKSRRPATYRGDQHPRSINWLAATATFMSREILLVPAAPSLTVAGSACGLLGCCSARSSGAVRRAAARQHRA